jgi:hypothetical protein
MTVLEWRSVSMYPMAFSGGRIWSGGWVWILEVEGHGERMGEHELMS